MKDVNAKRSDSLNANLFRFDSRRLTSSYINVQQIGEIEVCKGIRRQARAHAQFSSMCFVANSMPSKCYASERSLASCEMGRVLDWRVHSLEKVTTRMVSIVISDSAFPSTF